MKITSPRYYPPADDIDALTSTIKEEADADGGKLIRTIRCHE